MSQQDPHTNQDRDDAQFKSNCRQQPGSERGLERAIIGLTIQDDGDEERRKRFGQDAERQEQHERLPDGQSRPDSRMSRPKLRGRPGRDEPGREDQQEREQPRGGPAKLRRQGVERGESGPPPVVDQEARIAQRRGRHEVVIQVVVVVGAMRPEGQDDRGQGKQAEVKAQFQPVGLGGW